MADLHGVQDLNGWTFTFADNLVTQLKVDYRFTLMLENGVEIVTAEPFDLSDASGSEMVPPGETVYEVQAALPLFNQRVEQVRASSDGVLRVTFDGGSEIVVPTNHSFEKLADRVSRWTHVDRLRGGGIALHPEGHS